MEPGLSPPLCMLAAETEAAGTAGREARIQKTKPATDHRGPLACDLDGITGNAVRGPSSREITAQ
jgi:hypothetical protein